MTDAGPRIVVLTPHPTSPAVLTMPDGVGLPTTTVEGEYRTSRCIAAVETLLGRLPAVLRVDQRGSDGADGDPTLVVVDLETLGAEVPDGFTWTEWRGLPIERIEPEELRAAVGRWIARREHGPTPTDPPWAIPGWFERASGWMTARLADVGSPVLEPPRPVYSWGLSMLLRAPTAVGPVFLKCSTPHFEREAALTNVLAGATPDLVTDVIDVDADENWLLMRDHGDHALGDEPAEAWGPGLATYAAIQRAWRDRTAELVAGGAPERPLAALAEAMPGFADREALASRLTAEERAAWVAAMPACIEACHRLDRLGPAPTLVHGDLHPWNVAGSATTPRIFDWSDAAVTHPFLDLAVYVTRTPDIATRRALRDGYLAHWADDLGPRDLAAAGDLAIVVGTLYQVESYVRLVEALDPDDVSDLGDAARSWALAAIASVDEGIEVRRVGHADG